MSRPSISATHTRVESLINASEADELSSTPRNLGKGNQRAKEIGEYDEKAKREHVDDIQKGLTGEIMDSIFLNLAGLVEAIFPPIVFERLRGKRDPICLVNDPKFPNHKVADSNDSKPDAAVPVPHIDGQDAPEGVAPTVNDTGPQISTSYTPLDVDARPSRTRCAAPATTTHLTIDGILNALSTGKKPLYNNRQGKWLGFPNTRKIGTEKRLCTYLNKVLRRVREHVYGSETGPECGTEWIFSAEYATKEMKLDDVGRKPDIVLIPKGAPGRWEFVRSVGELRSSSYQSPRELALKRLPQYSRLMFGSDYSRRFALLFSLIGYRMTLFRYDRCGVLGSSQFNVHRDPKNFLRVIVGLGLGEDFFAGLDPSFFFKGPTRFVRLNEEEYEILETLHLQSVIRGRGTVALRVIIDPETGKQGVIKDQWVDTAREYQEFFWLLHLGEHGAKNVAMLEDHQLVRFKIGEDIMVDETSTIRKLVSDPKKDEIEIREHRRVLVTPAGELLKCFRSLKELVSVFIDFAEGILSVYRAKVYHRDISRRNLVIFREEGDAIGKGYVIDFDCAAFHKHVRHGVAELTVSIAHIQGTVPFMAISILKNNGCPHKFYYELESLFYTLVWICLTANGPKEDGCVTPATSFSKTQLPLWCGPKKDDPDEEEAVFQQIANNKSAVLTSDEEFETRILSQLPSYFAPIRGMLEELRDFLFRPKPKNSGIAPPKSLYEVPADLKQYIDQLRGPEFLKDRADAEEAIREFTRILKKTFGGLQPNGANRVPTEPASANEGQVENVINDHEVEAMERAAQRQLLQVRGYAKMPPKPEGCPADEAMPQDDGDSSSEGEASCDLGSPTPCPLKDSQSVDLLGLDNQSRDYASSGSRTAVSQTGSTSMSAFSRTAIALRAASLADKEDITCLDSSRHRGAPQGRGSQSIASGSRDTSSIRSKRAAPEPDQSHSSSKRRRR